MTDMPEVRPLPFGDSAISAAIDEALARVPDGKHAAVVAHADLKGARLAVMFKVGDAWSFGGYLEKPYSGELQGAAEVRFTA